MLDAALAGLDSVCEFGRAGDGCRGGLKADGGSVTVFVLDAGDELTRELDMTGLDISDVAADRALAPESSK